MKNLKISIQRACRLLALLLCLTAAIPQALANDFTIYVRCSTPSHASSTYLYAWGSGISISWPGTPISGFQQTTINGNTYYYTTLTSNDGQIGVILDRGNGQPQTSDLTAYPGNNYFVYDGSRSVSYEYFVVGDNTSIFTNGWSRGNSTMMTGSGNSYTWTSGEVQLTQGTSYQYKVTGSDNSWYPSGDNASFTVNATGTYTVTVTFNKSTGAVNATANLVQPIVTTTYYVVGADTGVFPNGWAASSATEMSETSTDNYSWTASNVHLTAGTTYDYKVTDGGSGWYPNDNATFNVDKNGNYNVLFTFNSNTHAVNAVPSLINEDQTYTYDIYVRYTGNENVANVYAYSFDSYGVNALGNWGGTALTDAAFTSQVINGHTYYHTTITSYDPQVKIIFNENQSGSTQTSNLNLQAGDNYFTYGGGSTVMGPSSSPDAAVTDYYVVGEDANIFPEQWNTGSANLMTKNNDIYSWTASNVHLVTGTSYEYKVRGSDGTWHPDGPDNATFNVDKNGNYNVLFTFNSNTHAVNAVPSLINEDQTYTYDIYVRYTGNENVANVYAYSFDSYGVNALGNWGGTALTDAAFTAQVINGHTYYHTTITSYDPQAKIILNENQSGSTQTSNLDLQVGDNYFTYGGGSIVSGPNTQADEADPTYDYTIYVRYKGNATPHMYLWEGTNTELLSGFPGQALTDNAYFTTEVINGYTYYKYTVTGSHYPSLGMILNEGNNGQTSDLTVSPGTSYYTYGGGSTYDGPKTEADPAIIYYAQSSFGGWTTDGTQMTANGDGSYSKTFTGVNLTGGATNEYKVYGVDGTNDGVWIGDSNGDNVTFTVSMSGTYDVTITLNSDGTLSHQFTMTAPATIYIEGDGVLGSFSYTPDKVMTYEGNGIYTWTATLADKAKTQFVFADGQGTSWEDFNDNYRIGPANGNETYTVNSGYTGTQHAGGDNGSYSVTAGAGELKFYFDAVNMQYQVTGTVPPVFYYVKGTPSSIFPNGWDNVGPETKMTQDATTGNYTWSANGIHLTHNGEYKFKVFGDDDSWYPADDVNLEFNVDGTYNLVINFDGTNVTYDLTLVQADSQGTYYITGSQGLGLGWSYAPETEMTFDDSTGLYTYTTHVDEGGMYNFVFANGQGNDWDDFNGNYRIGPASSNNQAITPDGNWNSTQMANGNDGSYSITVNPGTITFTLDPANMRFNVEADVLTHNYTFYVLPSDHQTVPYIYLWGLGTDEAYSNTYPGNQLTQTEVLDDGNTWYKLSVDLTVEYIHALVNGGGNDADNTKTADITHIDPGTYYIYWTTTREPGENYNDYYLTTVPPSHPGGTLFMIGTYYYNKVQYHYDPSRGVQFKYDANSKLYYLNNVNLAVHNTFCFTTQLSTNIDDWDNVGTRYGNSGSNEHVEGDGVTNYFPIDENWVNKAISLDEWSQINGEYRMLVPGIYNVLVNLEEKWVKLIKTDYYELTPMNVFLEQTPNVTMSEDGNNFIQNPGTEYSTQIFGDGNWPLAAYNGTFGDGVWNPHDNGNKYPVTYVGDTTTVDGKKWWHWQVEASIAELFFTRLHNEPLQSDTIRRKAGVLWVTWDEIDGQATLTDHSREYFEAAANALPTNAVVMEGHYYVYFINTVDWERVYCYAWDNNEVEGGGIDHTFLDGYSRQMNIWPGQPCELVGIDPVTGYEVWRYDFGTIIGTEIPNGGIIFNDGNEYAETEAKEQTGDFEYVNGAVYDYLGMVDGAFTLNNLIRKGAKDVRYTVSNDLLGVYYDPDAVTRIWYKDEHEELIYEDITGALYAKDLNLYGEKSVKPDSTYTDYVYDICASDHTAGRSQVMIKKTTYDQSNWVKLIMSPNYDGGGAVVPKDERPNLKQYVNHIIPGGSLDVFMTDSINPTAHVLRIAMGHPMSYEPNVYVTEHFNDTVVFNYVHQDWLGADAEFPYAYSCQPEIVWDYDTIEDIVSVTGGRAIRKPNYSHPYKMFYVAPKPQEIAYITWAVYDNYNQDGTWQGYSHDYYSPYTRESVSENYPEDPGRFYSPMNWDRTVYLDAAAYPQMSQLTEASDIEKALGAWSPEYGPFSNGYMQYGGFKVNWSLFDMEASGGPWWQIIKPGQAYKFKAIIRYARGSGYTDNENDFDDTADNYYYGPSNGYYTVDDNGNIIPGPGTVLHAPRRGSEETGYANMYFTDYDFMDKSKFIIFPIEASSSESNGNDMGNVTSVKEVIANAPTARTITSVRYYNVMGAESDKPFDGINIVVTTFSDGSRVSRKILR